MEKLPDTSSNGIDKVSEIISILPQLGSKLQETVLVVQRLRVEHKYVMEMYTKLTQEKLDLEQQLDDLQVTHKKKMEHMASNGKQLGSYQPMEQLSGVGAAVIQDVKILRQQFRQAKQEVDSLENQLVDMEKVFNQAKEIAAVKEKEKEGIERLAKLLEYNIKQLEEEQATLGQVLQAGKEANTCLYQDRIVMQQLISKVEEENRNLENKVWKKETDVIDVNKNISSEVEVKVDVDSKIDGIADLESDVDAEVERLEVELGEKLCELESIQNCLEGTQKIVAQMKVSSLCEDEEWKQIVSLEKELKDIGRQREEEQEEWDRKILVLRERVRSLENEKDEKEGFLKEQNAFEMMKENQFMNNSDLIWNKDEGIESMAKADTEVKDLELENDDKEC